MLKLRTIKYTGQNAEPGMVENGDSSGQTRPSQVQNYSRPSNSRQRRYSSSATMLPTDFADGLLEYTINRVSKPVFNESSMLDSDLQEPMATTEQTDIQKRPARINSRLLNLMRQSDGFNANEMLLKFCFDQIFTGLTLDEIIRRLEVSQTSKNITRMRLDLLILAEYSNSHPQILNASDNQSDRLLSNLDSLLQVYKHQVWLSEQWDCSLPRQLRLNIINSHQYNCTVFTTVSLSQSMAKEMAVRAPRVAMRLLIIDHDFTRESSCVWTLLQFNTPQISDFCLNKQSRLPLVRRSFRLWKAIPAGQLSMSTISVSLAMGYIQPNIERGSKRQNWHLRQTGLMGPITQGCFTHQETTFLTIISNHTSTTSSY